MLVASRFYPGCVVAVGPRSLATSRKWGAPRGERPTPGPVRAVARARAPLERLGHAAKLAPALRELAIRLLSLELATVASQREVESLWHLRHLPAPLSASRERQRGRGPASECGRGTIAAFAKVRPAAVEGPGLVVPLDPLPRRLADLAPARRGPAARLVPRSRRGPASLPPPLVSRGVATLARIFQAHLRIVMLSALVASEVPAGHGEPPPAPS